MTTIDALIERLRGTTGPDRGAVISDCGLYRYALWRHWDDRPRALFIMLNPSTADAEIDDPTIRRCIGFAKSWGLGGVRVVNLYPFRATKPTDLWLAAVPEGYGNISYIEQAVDPAGICIAAWGAHGKENRIREVRNLFQRISTTLYALKLTKDGQPGHPLYLAANTIPVVYEPAGSGLTRGQTATLTALQQTEAQS